MVDAVRQQIANHNGFSVHKIHTDQLHGDYDTTGIPDKKCYKSPKFTNKYFELMTPIYSVSDNVRYFDINHKIATLHGSCMNDGNNDPISPVIFRQQNPDMEFGLGLAQLRETIADIPVLSMHFGLDQLPPLQLQACQLFESTVSAWATSDQLYATVRAHYHANCMLSQLPLKQGKHVILLDALIDELRLAWPNLIQNIAHQLTHNVLENYAERNQVIGSLIANWVDTSSYGRICQRRAPQQAQMFCNTLKISLFEKIEQQLNTSILEVIRNAK